MKKINIYLLTAVLASCMSCTREEPNYYRNNYAAVLANSPYYAIVERDAEIFARYWYEDMHLLRDSAKDNPYFKNVSPITYDLGGQKHLKISDECNKTNHGTETEFVITRTINFDNIDSIQYPIESHVANTKPIKFIRPYSTNCSPTPPCYFHDMEIEWNADENNQNGVVILVEWQGTSISAPMQDISIVSADIVEDNGHTVLRNELFDRIPDEAFVNLYLMRANFGKIDESEIRKELQEKVLDLLNNPKLANYPKRDIQSIIKDSQLPITVSGSVALLPIILIREL